jgi:serine/threonine-protein kinase
VADKRLHMHLADDAAFVAMLIDEARLAARIRHPNVVTTLDAIQDQGELFLVMDYVPGVSLASLDRLSRAEGAEGSPGVPIPVLLSIACGVLHGLHAAHEAVDEAGHPLSIVHRDVSPQNILVGVDGLARVLDFGIAKAEGRVQSTREGILKGKPSYMAPEVIRGGAVDRRADVFAAGVVVWEGLTGRSLFGGAGSMEGTLASVLDGVVPPPSSVAPDVPPRLDAIVLRALSRDPTKRFSTALDMARAIEAVAPVSTAADVGQWVTGLAGEELKRLADAVAAIERADQAQDRNGSPAGKGTSVTPPVPRTSVGLRRPDRARWVLAGVGASILAMGVAWMALRPTALAVVPPPAPVVSPAVSAPVVEVSLDASPRAVTPASSSEAAPPVASSAAPRSAPRVPRPAPRPTGAIRFRDPG